mgnify:CR=1 FL=1
MTRYEKIKMNPHRVCINSIDMYILIVYLADMKTTLNIDDRILNKASELTGISEKTALVRKGLEALIAQESARRLASLGGTEKQIKDIPRRKSGME